MEKDKKHFFQQIHKVNKARNLYLPLQALIIVPGLGFALISILSVAGICLPHLGILILLGGTYICGLAGGIVFLFIRRQSLHQTAAYMDMRLGTENQLESAVELHDGDNPLQEAQFNDANRCMHNITPHNFYRLIQPVPLLGVIFGCLLMTTLALALFTTICMSAAEEKMWPPHRPKSGTKAEKELLRAELIITTPEKTLQLSPLDMVEWEGDVESNHGFKAVSVEIFLNGEWKKSIDISGGETGFIKGKTSLIGDFAIEDTEAEPFNLVTFHLKGMVVRGEEILEVTSVPRFIQIKPLKEDIFIIDGGGKGGSADKFAAYMKTLLTQQIELNELLFIAMAATGADSSTVYKMYHHLAHEQSELEQGLEKFLAEKTNAENPLEQLSPLMFKSLENATKNMAEAEKQLRLAGNKKPNKQESAEAGAFQQKAIADILNSLKELKKIMAKNSGQAENPTPSPENQKQQENPGQLLEKAIQQEETIIKSGQNADFKLEAVKQPQSEISWSLKLLQEKSELAEDVSREIIIAADHSSKTENAINSNADNAFKISAAKTLDHMRQALEELKQKSAESMGKSLNEARKELTKTQKEMNQQKNSEQAAETLKKTSEQLAKEAQKQKKSGTEANSKTMKALADKIKEKAGKVSSMSKEKAEKTIDELKKELANTRPGNESSPEALTKKLGEQRRWINYMEKHSGATGEKEVQDMLLDMEMTLEDIKDLLEKQGNTPDTAAMQQNVNKMQGNLNQAWEQNRSRRFGDRIAPALALVKADIDGMIKLLEASGIRPDLPSFQQFTPDQIPVEYREQTAQYFEKLSRLRNNGNKGKN